jgi:dolichyl-phosphate-mannose-protein mannosyltransferase
MRHGPPALVFGEDLFFAERVLALVLIAAIALWLRAQSPDYSTAYMDESVYVVYGRMFLARHFEAPIASPLRWSLGWYLWPIIAALMDRLGGIIAVRELSAVAGTGVVIAVYGIARRLYDTPVALGAAAVFAVLGPAVMAFRIATRDVGAIFFLAFGLMAYVKASQEDKRDSWLVAAALLFCGFLCKYIVAVYFPFLVVLGVHNRRRAWVWFCAPLAVASSVYLVHYRHELYDLLQYGGAYGSLSASGGKLWYVDVTTRIELWLIASIAVLALVASGRRRISLLLWLGAAVALAFQWKTRADFDFWKHSAYPLLFLTPVAVHGIIAAARRLGRTYQTQVTMAVVAIVFLAAGSAWAGKSLRPAQNVFWPGVEPILAYFEGRLPSDAHLLVDDSVLRYYFHPTLHQSQIVDPYYFHYGDAEGEAAYRKAVEDGWFDYIVLDGGLGKEAELMHVAIRPYLTRYTLRMTMPDPALGQKIEIYERTAPAAEALPAGSISVALTSPRSGAAVPPLSNITGNAIGAASGWYVRLEVFSNRWYSCGRYFVRQDGTFESSPVPFGGQAVQACNHMVRARLYDSSSRPRAVAVSFNVVRQGANCR